VFASSAESRHELYFFWINWFDDSEFSPCANTGAAAANTASAATDDNKTFFICFLLFYIKNIFIW